MAHGQPSLSFKLCSPLTDTLHKKNFAEHLQFPPTIVGTTSTTTTTSATSTTTCTSGGGSTRGSTSSTHFVHASFFFLLLLFQSSWSKWRLGNVFMSYPDTRVEISTWVQYPYEIQTLQMLN
jgi:hypothetical protein